MSLHLLYISVLSWVTQGVHADENPYLRQARLRFRSGHAQAAHSHPPDTNGTGPAPRCLCFLLAAILALVYTFWAFSVSLIELPMFSMDQQPGHIAQGIIEIVSGLLLVLIIMEMLGTVIHYLQVHTTSLRPFLFIGIVSATRSILSIGARLSVDRV